MISIFNAIISGLGVVLQSLVSLLPDSPFQFTLSIDSSWINAINWIFPFSSVVAHLSLYLTAVVSFYGIRIILRWIKAVGN